MKRRGHRAVGGGTGLVRVRPSNEHAARRARRRAPPREDSIRRYDIFARFARRHLSTREQRAVYLTLVSQEAESWSAAEIAGLKRLDECDIERIFEAYEASGIVEAIDTTGGRRYRWRSDMNYLFGDVSDSPDWVDPVCGMPVTEESPYRAIDPFGRPRRFCASLCLAAFRASPGTFSGAAGQKGEASGL